MIKVIKKDSTHEINAASISKADIEALDTGTSIIFLEPVKQSINITYDALGYADVSFINLGVQFDHRVTWLHFNLDKLLWNLDENRDYTAETKYNHYTFKMALTNIDGTSAGETTVWEFDGVNFEIPRYITKEAGTYKIVLMIEEYQKDDFVGNIKEDTPDKIERFVTAEIKGKVYPSIYNPDYDIIAEVVETDQSSALIKPKIECTLSDDGDFVIDETELGQKHDSFIRYLKFNPNRITAHLNDFNLFAIFKHDDLFYYSLFERTSADDPLDDYSASHPVIAWIPRGVYQTSGMWEVAIIAFTGNIEDINDNNGNGDYYFYVSKSYKMRVVDNNLTEELATQEPILSITSNLFTSLGEIIITKDNKMYQLEDKK